MLGGLVDAWKGRGGQVPPEIRAWSEGEVTRTGGPGCRVNPAVCSLLALCNLLRTKKSETVEVDLAGASSFIPGLLSFFPKNKIQCQRDLRGWACLSDPGLTTPTPL